MAPGTVVIERLSAGHSDFKTTQHYIDLAEVVFSGEVAKLSAWYQDLVPKRVEGDGSGLGSAVAPADG